MAKKAGKKTKAKGYYVTEDKDEFLALRMGDHEGRWVASERLGLFNLTDALNKALPNLAARVDTYKKLLSELGGTGSTKGKKRGRPAKANKGKRGRPAGTGKKKAKPAKAAKAKKAKGKKNFSPWAKASHQVKKNLQVGATSPIPKDKQTAYEKGMKDKGFDPANRGKKV